MSETIPNMSYQTASAKDTVRFVVGWLGEVTGSSESVVKRALKLMLAKLFSRDPTRSRICEVEVLHWTEYYMIS